MKEVKSDPFYLLCFVSIWTFVILAFTGCSVSLIGGRHINTYMYKSEGASPEVTMEAPSQTEARDMLKAPLSDTPIPDFVMPDMPQIEDIPVPDDDPDADFPTFPLSML